MLPRQNTPIFKTRDEIVESYRLFGLEATRIPTTREMYLIIGAQISVNAGQPAKGTVTHNGHFVPIDFVSEKKREMIVLPVCDVYGYPDYFVFELPGTEEEQAAQQ
ncbi:MAG: hypothetical protein JXR97_12755 [Planctomycetes bacterium]|nr:hypothetical protein [Planctomycetota bacterium]